MAKTIKVNPDSLNDEIQVLSDLATSDEVINKVKNLIGSFSVSTGDAADVIKDINTEILDIDTSMKLLFQRTVDFLNNTSTQFVEADSSVASSIEGAFESLNGGE